MFVYNQLRVGFDISLWFRYFCKTSLQLDAIFKMNFFLSLFILLLNYASPFQDEIKSISRLPKIIWWTNLIFPHFKSSVEIFCGDSRCLSTSDTNFQTKDEDMIAYIFYGSNFDFEKLPLPRKPTHLWCLLHEESPMNNYIFSHTVGIRLFNYTGTFSRFSDFPLSTQFLPSIDYLTGRKPIPVHRKNELRQAGFAPVLYVQSHCNIASDRDRYVKKLMQFIDIDSYGTCLHNKDLPSHLNSTALYSEESFLKFIAQYKFHIAFENALCDDYITEKFFRPLHVGSIPIYKGSPSIKDWMPSQTSVIVADDFQSPEHLAKFLKELDQNDELYNSYLTFKNEVTNQYLIQTVNDRSWGVNNPNKLDFITGFECFICDNLVKIGNSHSEERKSKVADKKHMNCHQPHSSLETDMNLSLNDSWIKEGWAESYWFAFDQAKALHKMIENKETNSRLFWQYMMQSKYEH